MDTESIKAKSRIAIIALKDDKGVVDKYVECLLDAILPFIQTAYAVTSNTISSSDIDKFNHRNIEVIKTSSYSSNSFHMYQQGIASIGWELIEKHDELLLIDTSIMGEVNPFKDMFEEMDKSENPFWGIANGFYKNRDGEYVSFLQPFFLEISNVAFSIHEFKTFWNNTFENNEEYYSYSLGKKIKDAGLEVSEYVNTDDLKEFTSNPLLFDTKKLVESRKCPIFLKKMFSYDYAEVLENTAGGRTKEFFSYLSKSGKYDVDLIWDTILRTEHQEDIARNLGLTYVLDINCKEIPTQLRTVVIAHIYYADLIDYMFSYLANVPEDIDILITTVSDSNKKLINSVVKCKGLKNKVHVKVIENRGRDVSSLLVGAKEILCNYDIACFIHDKKTPQIEKRAVGEDFGKICYENLLVNKGYISHVVSLFAENKRLGMLMPPFPSFGSIYKVVGNEWGPNYKSSEKLAMALRIDVPIDEKKRSMAPYGTCFWFRVSALNKLLNKAWKYVDFPEEPNGTDGTILHAIERLYSFVAQDAGYYMAEVMNTEYSSVEHQRLSYYLEQNNARLTKLFGEIGFKDLTRALDVAYLTRKHGKSRITQERVRKPHSKGVDYMIKDMMHAVLPKKIFETIINEKRKRFGPFKEYSEKKDERYFT